MAAQLSKNWASRAQLVYFSRLDQVHDPTSRFQFDRTGNRAVLRCAPANAAAANPAVFRLIANKNCAARAYVAKSCFMVAGMQQGNCELVPNLLKRYGHR